MKTVEKESSNVKTIGPEWQEQWSIGPQNNKWPKENKWVEEVPKNEVVSP